MAEWATVILGATGKWWLLFASGLEFLEKKPRWDKTERQGAIYRGNIYFPYLKIKEPEVLAALLSPFSDLMAVGSDLKSLTVG